MQIFLPSNFPRSINNRIRRSSCILCTGNRVRYFDPSGTVDFTLKSCMNSLAIDGITRKHPIAID